MNKLLIIKANIFIMCCIAGFTARGTNYYFSQSTGNDAWAGTLPSPNTGNTNGPKQSISAFNTLINSIAQAGDSILLKRGDLWVGSTGISASSAHGTVNNYLVIGAYGTGSKPLITKTGIGEVINCRGSANYASSYLKFQNLALTTNSPSGSKPTGINVNESFYSLKPHHIIFDSLHIYNCQNGMILYQQNLIVQNCLIEKNGNIGQGHAIFVRADTVVFKNNTLDSNGCGSFFVHTMYISNCNNVLFEGNEIKNADDGLKLRASTNVVVRNNVIHDMYTHTIHLGGDDMAGTSNITVEGNLIYNAPQGLTIKSESGTQTLFTESITIKNNIFPAQISVSSTCPVKDIYIYNNLIYSSGNQNELFLFNSLNPINVRIKNNIFCKNTSSTTHSLVNIMASSGFTGITMDNNLYYFTSTNGRIVQIGSNYYTTLSTFKAAFPTQEVNGQQGDPGFVAAPTNFHLTSSSTLAIDKGTDLTGIVDVDLEGTKRPVNGDGINNALWDIGPYEYTIPLGKVELSKATEIAVYPVPTNGEITIVTPNEVAVKIVVIDVFGNVVLENYPIYAQSILSLVKFNTGIYFVQLYLVSGIYTKKIVKQE